MKKFTVNQKIKARSICDHNCVWEGEVLKRTTKTVTVRVDGENGPKRCKIHLDGEGNEFIYPLGRYSMCPIMRAA